MKTVFVGAGNLATRLSIEMNKHGFRIVQVYSRTMDSADKLARQFGCEAINDISNIYTDADLYIFSVKDDALPDLLKEIPANNGIWTHTAGSIPMEVFMGYNRQYGVVYPFQTFSKNRTVTFRDIPLFLEADSTETMNKLKHIFSTLSDKVIELASEKRKYLHLTGVFACNFVNHLYAISQKILEKENIPFNVVLPLIDETAAKIHEMNPVDAQTGPAVRYDTSVMEKHVALLDETSMKEIYELLSKSIYETANNKQI